MELLLGCGRSREKRIVYPGRSKDWVQLVTLDYRTEHCPDVVHDLRERPWPFKDDTFDEVHAYETLEHLGSLGDEVAFFADFFECWRILKPGGHLCATVPHWKDMWALGDPGHRRVINDGSLVFLDREEYVKQVDGKGPKCMEARTAMSDYRWCWQGDFVRVGQQYRADSFIFVLEAQKPPRFLQ